MNSASVKETRVIPTVSVEEFYRRLDATGICRISSRSARTNADAEVDFTQDPKTGQMTGSKPSGKNKGKAPTEPREIPVTPSKPYSDYLDANNGDHYEAAQEFYDKELRDGYVKAEIGGKGKQEVNFVGGKTLRKIKFGMGGDPLKAELINRVPDILRTGSYISHGLFKAHPPFVDFHHFGKIVDTSAGKKYAIVDVGERSDGQFEYSVWSFIHEGNKGFANKFRSIVKDLFVAG